MFGPKICYPVCYHFTKLVCYVRHSRVSEYQILRALMFYLYVWIFRYNQDKNRGLDLTNSSLSIQTNQVCSTT